MEIVQNNTTFHWWLGLILHGRIVTVMRRLLIRSKRRVLIASDYLGRALAPGRASTRQSRPDANGSRPLVPGREVGSGDTGTLVPVSPVWTRATGREPFAIDRERFGNVSCGHGQVLQDWCSVARSTIVSIKATQIHTLSSAPPLLWFGTDMYGATLLVSTSV